jgi:hypothetical protein
LHVRGLEWVYLDQTRVDSLSYGTIGEDHLPVMVDP